MGGKLCPKIILEGTRLTLKTDIAFALNEHPRIVGPRKYRYHSPLVSAEWCAFTSFPWGRGLINFAREEEAQAMEERVAMARQTCDALKRWLTDVEVEERKLSENIRLLERDLREVLPALGYELEDAPAAANVVPLPKQK